MFRIYNVAAYVTVLGYLSAVTFVAPLHGSPALGLAVGAAYFVFVWFVMGIYLGDVVHLGLAHRSLDVRPWFVQFIAVFANLFGVYLNPYTWTNRHRLHHKNADHSGDPNKLASDGFWKTCILMVLPYECVADVTPDPIFKTWPMRLCSNLAFGVFAQVTSFWWTHERRHGSRRYPDDPDNAVNISNWLPVALSFSACLQNNHHHHPRFVRLSLDETEPDWGFHTVRWLCRLRLAAPSPEGARVPDGIPFRTLGL